MAVIYKIVAAAQWRAAEERGVYSGSDVDVRDGFIHLSTKEQVTETARRHFAGRSAIGQTVRLGLRGRPQVDIVGVASDTRHMSLREAAQPTIYLPFIPEDEPWIEIDIRSQLPAAQVHAAVLAILPELAPGASVEFRSIDTGITYAAARDRVVASLAAGFAMLALLLSAIGLYGVMSHQVIRRRQELGVRIAIGAAPSSVTRMILAHSAGVIAIGIALGLAGAIASGRLIAALLYNVTPYDPASIAAAVVFLILTTIAAAMIPAVRASRVDPMTALREE